MLRPHSPTEGICPHCGAPWVLHCDCWLCLLFLYSCGCCELAAHPLSLLLAVLCSGPALWSCLACGPDSYNIPDADTICYRALFRSWLHFAWMLPSFGGIWWCDLSCTVTAVYACPFLRDSRDVLDVLVAFLLTSYQPCLFNCCVTSHIALLGWHSLRNCCQSVGLFDQLFTKLQFIKINRS